MVFPDTPLVVTISLFAGGSWADVTPDVYARDRIAITWGRQDWASTADTTKVALTFNNGTSTASPGVVGRYSPKNPRSDLYGLIGRNTPIRIELATPAGALVGRFEGHVSSWPTRWDVSGHDVYTTVQANGIRRRLAQGKKALKDPLRRHIDASGPLLYWPLTDGTTAREGTEVVQGSQPMRALGQAGSFHQGQPDWGKGTLAPWLDPTVEVPDETQGYLTAYIAPANVSSWSFDYAIAIPGTENLATLKLADTGQQTNASPQTEWQVLTLASTNLVQVLATDRDDTGSATTVLDADLTTNVFDGGVHHLRLTVTDDGGNPAWALYVDGALLLSGSRTTAYRPLSRVSFGWLTNTGDGNDTIAVGHLAYWGQTPPGAAFTWRAVQGYNREVAGRRIERLCAEEGVPLTVNGSLDQTPAMGPQKSGAFLDLLQSAADVDGGALYEARDAAGLAYRTRTSKYNQGV